jgi:hypothetical protein
MDALRLGNIEDSLPCLGANAKNPDHDLIKITCNRQPINDMSASDSASSSLGAMSYGTIAGSK